MKKIDIFGGQKENNTLLESKQLEEQRSHLKGIWIGCAEQLGFEFNDEQNWKVRRVTELDLKLKSPKTEVNMTDYEMNENEGDDCTSVVDNTHIKYTKFLYTTWIQLLVEWTKASFFDTCKKQW